MPAIHFAASVALVVSACLLGAVLLRSILQDRRGRLTSSQSAGAGTEGAVFLFDGVTLVDATRAGLGILDGRGHGGSDWADLCARLAARFPMLDPGGHAGPVPGHYLSCAPDDPGVVEVEAWDGMVRITLRDEAAVTAAIHPAALAALESEVETLRAVSRDAPYPVWQQALDGTILWVNAAYLALADRATPAHDAQRWPPPAIFGPEPSSSPDGEGTIRRVAVDRADSDTPLWFDIVAVLRAGTVTQFALDANASVRAESQGRAFVQTLTKTFAQLAIGMAIFDRQRRLVIFNPALLDLTGLPVSFLTDRPLLRAVLDRLRDQQMLPEPRNYRSWRDQMTALELAAEQGTYCETWTLPAGQTYRVTGRPHPDGAIAFTFEDISAEISLTRHFRAELDTMQHVLDAMPDAVAVFSAAGTLTVANDAYVGLWGHSADQLTDVSLMNEIAGWQARTAPSPAWTMARAMRGTMSERRGWDVPLRLLDGRSATMSFAPLAGHATMVRFRIDALSQDSRASRDPLTPDLFAGIVVAEARRA